MSYTRIPDPRIVLQHYERGNITFTELIIDLCQAATVTPPEEIAPLLSEDLLSELRERSREPPKEPKGHRVFAMGMSLEESDTQSRLYVEGLRYWHRFFNQT